MSSAKHGGARPKTRPDDGRSRRRVRGPNPNAGRAPDLLARVADARMAYQRHHAKYNWDDKMAYCAALAAAQEDIEAMDGYSPRTIAQVATHIRALQTGDRLEIETANWQGWPVILVSGRAATITLNESDLVEAMRLAQIWVEPDIRQSNAG